MAKDARQPAATEPRSGDLTAPEPGAAGGSSTGRAQQPQQQQVVVVAPSTVINIAVHSLLMVTVPFVLFFASFLGGLDPLIALTGASIPSREVKSYIGAGLAVLGVNLVIASFVLAAFREDAKPLKQD